MEWKRTIAKRAMKLWVQGFKPPRKSKPLRFSSGLKAEKKKQLRLQGSKPSISSWLQRRRQSVKEKSLSQNKEKTADLVEEHEPLRKKAKRAAGSSWTDKHEKHENKLRDLAASRRFEAQRSGHLVEGEKKISSNKYQEMEEKQFANDKATKRKNAMVSQVLGVTQPNLI